MLRRAHDAVIEGEEDLPVGPLERGKDRNRGSQGAMHPGSPLVSRRTPHAMVDVRRRGDIGKREGEATAALRRGIFDAGKVGHSAGLNRFARIASRFASRFAAAELCHGAPSKFTGTITRNGNPCSPWISSTLRKLDKKTPQKEWETTKSSGNV